MPLYEYECQACGHRFERIQSFSDPIVKKCPRCGKRKVKKLLSSPAIQFKGSGFYITDYQRKGSGTLGRHELGLPEAGGDPVRLRRTGRGRRHPLRRSHLGEQQRQLRGRPGPRTRHAEPRRHPLAEARGNRQRRAGDFRRSDLHPAGQHCRREGPRLPRRLARRRGSRVLHCRVLFLPGATLTPRR